MEEKTTAIAVFNGKNIRKAIYQNEWWFSVIDVVEVLTESSIPRRYWTDLKRNITEKEGFNQLYAKIVQLKMLALDGKWRETECANTETMLRVVQSIPSPKAEPFKRWLARVGYERVQEIADPELATKRTHALYKAKGYSDSWIAKRMRGIEVRDELTNEWGNRGAKEGRDYAILTNDIMKGTFDMTVSDYKKFKDLRRENLRDHMDDMEMILTMLGEATTTRLTQARESKDVPRLRADAKDGGKIAGDTRKVIERQTDKKVATKNNFLGKPENRKKIR